MALSGSDLADKIMDTQKNLTKKYLENDDSSKSDEDLAKEGKVRVNYEESTKIMDTEKAKNTDYIKEMGQVIVDYIKNNTEFVYSTIITWSMPPYGTSSPDPLVSVSNTVKIESISNTLSGHYPSVTAFLTAIENSIKTASIDLGSPNGIFSASGKGSFSPSLKIIYTPTGEWEDNMKSLGNAIISAVKLAINPTPISCTDTVPPAMSSSGTAIMTKIS